jgi:hypothetical protein
MAIIREIPLGEPVVLDVRTWGYDEQPDPKTGKKEWRKHMTQCACIPVQFNSDSIRVSIIAVENLYSPFSQCSLNSYGGKQAIRFGYIRSWEPLKKEELPLSLGWKHTNLYEEMLKGKL